MKNKYFKKIKVISFFLVLITMIILFFYREKVFRDEQFMYEEQIAEMDHRLEQAEEASKIMAEKIAKEAGAEKITGETKIEVEDSDEITRGDVTRDAVDSGETVQDETSESANSHSAWVAENRQMKVGALPVRYYIEQTQIALEDTDENVGTVLYFENPVFLMGDSCDGWSWGDNSSPEAVIINELLDKKRDEFIDRYKEDFKNISVVGFVDFGMDALLRYPYYCTKDVTSIYYNEDGILSIGYFYTWYAGGSPPSEYDSVNVDWHTGKEISLPEFLNMSNEETRGLVAEKVLEHKENHPELDWGSQADFLKERDAEEFEKMKFYVWEDEVWVLFDGGRMMVSSNDPIKIRIR